MWQIVLHYLCVRVRASEHAPRGPFRVLERRHGLAEIVERGGGVHVVLRKMTPVARDALGENAVITLKLRSVYAEALYEDPGATLADLREAVTTLEDAERIARRVLGGAHPTTAGIEAALRDARAALHARETP